MAAARKFAAVDWWWLIVASFSLIEQTRASHSSSRIRGHLPFGRDPRGRIPYRWIEMNCLSTGSGAHVSQLMHFLVQQLRLLRKSN